MLRIPASPLCDVFNNLYCLCIDRLLLFSEPDKFGT